VLVCVERAVLTHYWWVTKRLLKSPFTQPLAGQKQSCAEVDDQQLSRSEAIAEVWTPVFKAKLLGATRRQGGGM
jgi:hypothetical protein